MNRLEGRVAVVTGAGRGIGRAIAMGLAREGAKVVVNNRSTAAQDVVEEIRAEQGLAISHIGDVGDRDAAEDLISRAIDTWGTLDILVNNAGQQVSGTITSMSEEDFDDVIRVHLKGTFNTTQFAARHWVKTNYGRLINMTSRTAIDGTPKFVSYGAAKAGIIGLTRSAACALVGHNVTANCIAPIAVTRMFNHTPVAKDYFEKTGKWPSDLPDVGPLDPSNVAPLAVYLASEQAGYISGKVFEALGLRYTLYGDMEQVASVSAPGSDWDIEQLFDEFSRTIGAGLTPRFNSYLDHIDGPHLLSTAASDSMKLFG